MSLLYKHYLLFNIKYHHEKSVEPMGFRLSDLDFVTALNDKNKDFEVTFDYKTSGEYKPLHEFKELTEQEKKEQIAFRE